MRVSVVVFAIVVSTTVVSTSPSPAQYQGMTIEQCRGIFDSQQRLTCLGQIRPQRQGRASIEPFSPIGLPAIIQPVAQVAEPEVKPDGNAASNRFRPARKAVARGE